MAAYGLYGHIRANRIRSVLLIMGLFFLLLLLTFGGSLIASVFVEGDAPLDYLLERSRANVFRSIPFVAIGTLLWLWIAWLFHQRMIDAMVGGHDVARADEPRLYNLLENLCISRGIPMPKLKIVEDNALNAFATGLNEKQYAISVTRGLMERLNDAELEAVLGHELTHIKNGDVTMLVVAVVIAGVISFFGEAVFRGVFRTGGYRARSSGDQKGGAAIAVLIALALVVVAWVLSIVIRFSLSRTREYLADAGAVELTKNPDAMIMALRKIEGRGELAGATASVMEMCVDNPHSGFVDLFSTHPTIEKRVQAIVKTAGGRDPGPIPMLAATGDSAVLPKPPPELTVEGPWVRKPVPTPNRLDPWHWGPWGPRRW